MSIAGRTTLINSSLTNTFIYHMSMYLLPKTLVADLDKKRRTFFWQGGSTKRKYHIVRWEVICKIKKKGGLGIKDIRKMNICLLCKWWWKLENEEGIWQEIVKAKYLRKQVVGSVSHKLDDSPVWSDLLKVKNIYLKGRTVKIGKGDVTLFWTDNWLEEPLCYRASVLFELCNEKMITVKDFYSKGGVLTFRRWLPEVLYKQWIEIYGKISRIPLGEGDDKHTWKCWSKGKFTVKSLYDQLGALDAGGPYPRIWTTKIPYKSRYSCGWWKKCHLNQG